METRPYKTTDTPHLCRRGGVHPPAIYTLNHPVQHMARNTPCVGTPLHGRGIKSRAHRTQALFFKEGGTNEVSDGCFGRAMRAPTGQQHPHRLRRDDHWSPVKRHSRNPCRGRRPRRPVNTNPPTWVVPEKVRLCHRTPPCPCGTSPLASEGGFTETFPYAPIGWVQGQ